MAQAPNNNTGNIEANINGGSTKSIGNFFSFDFTSGPDGVIDVVPKAGIEYKTFESHGSKTLAMVFRGTDDTSVGGCALISFSKLDLIGPYGENGYQFTGEVSAHLMKVSIVLQLATSINLKLFQCWRHIFDQMHQYQFKMHFEEGTIMEKWQRYGNTFEFLDKHELFSNSDDVSGSLEAFIDYVSSLSDENLIKMCDQLICGLGKIIQMIGPHFELHYTQLLISLLSLVGKVYQVASRMEDALHYLHLVTFVEKQVGEVSPCHVVKLLKWFSVIKNNSVFLDLFAIFNCNEKTYPAYGQRALKRHLLLKESVAAKQRPALTIRLLQLCGKVETTLNSDGTRNDSNMKQFSKYRNNYYENLCNQIGLPQNVIRCWISKESGTSDEEKYECCGDDIIMKTTAVVSLPSGNMGFGGVNESTQSGDVNDGTNGVGKGFLNEKQLNQLDMAMAADWLFNNSTMQENEFVSQFAAKYSSINFSNNKKDQLFAAFILDNISQYALTDNSISFINTNVSNSNNNNTNKNNNQMFVHLGNENKFDNISSLIG